MMRTLSIEPLFETDLFIWIVVGVLSAMFFVASTLKIFAWHRKTFDRQMESLTRFGLNRRIFFAIGLVELFGSLAIWLQGHYVGLAGVGVIALTSAGAIFYHLRSEPVGTAVPAMVTLLLSGIVVWHNVHRIWALLSV